MPGNKLSKKNQNDAVSQLRTLKQDVKKHTAVESVLEAFLTADRLMRGDHSPMGSQKPRWNGCHHLQPVS